MQTARDILGMSLKDARSLFPGDAAAVKRAYRALAGAWHPDRNSDRMAAEVFARLTELKDAAVRMAEGRPADPARDRTYRGPGGKSFRMRFVSTRPGPLGDVLVGRTHVAYEAPEDFADLVEAEAKAIGSFVYADAAMQAEMERFLPVLERTVSAPGVAANVLRKPSDTVLLADLAEHMGGRIPPVHAAWIVSGMLNLACYLHWSGRAHGAVSPETVFVCPRHHSVLLLGGWGFAARYGARPAALPERTASVLPRLALKGETVGSEVDLHLVRATACDILAAPGGGGLAMAADVPTAMKEWLQLPPAKDAYRDYEAWQQCLVQSFGKRSFVELGVDPSDIYGR